MWATTSSVSPTLLPMHALASYRKPQDGVVPLEVLLQQNDSDKPSAGAMPSLQHTRQASGHRLWMLGQAPGRCPLPHMSPVRMLRKVFDPWLG